MAILAVLSCSLFAAGCSSLRETPYGQYFQAVQHIWSAQFSDGAVTREQAGAIPYASLGYRFNGSQEQIVILATDNNGEQLWTASNHVVLNTHDGRLWRSVGLPLNMGGTTSAGDLPAPAQALKGPFSTTRLQDFPDLGLYGVTLNCQAVARGRMTITILGGKIPAARIDETCHANAGDWTFTDNYWVDPTSGMTWMAIQHIHPKGGILQMEILRPPS